MIDISPDLLLEEMRRRQQQGNIPAPNFAPPDPSQAAGPQSIPAPPMIGSIANTNQLPPYEPPTFQGPNVSPVSPVEQKFTEMLNAQPNREDYKPSIWRKIGAAIAGFGPEGPKAGRAFLNSPYNTAMQDWQSRLSSIEPQVSMEQQRRKEDLDRSKLAQTMAHQTNQDVVASKKVDISNKRAGLYGEDIESKISRREALNENDLRRMNIPKDETARVLQLEPEEQLQYIDTYNKLHPKESPAQAADKTAAREKAKIDVQFENKDKLGAVAAATGGTREKAVLEAKADAPLSTDEKDMVGSMVDKARENPDSAWDMLKLIPSAKAKANFITKVADVAPSKVLTADERRTVTAGKTAIMHANTIKDMLKDPEIQANIGPLQGRLADLDQVIGTNTFQTGSHAQKEAALSSVSNKGLSYKMAKLLDMYKYIILFESSSVSGTRPSWQLINYLKSTQGARFDMERAMGNLDASILSAGNRISSIYGPSKSGVPVEKKEKRLGFQVEVVQ